MELLEALLCAGCASFGGMLLQVLISVSCDTRQQDSTSGIAQIGLGIGALVLPNKDTIDYKSFESCSVSSNI